MGCQQPIREQIPWYVNGTLDARTRAAVESHLETCTDCRRYAAGLQTLSTGLAARPPALVPPEVQALLAKLPGRRPVLAPRPQLNQQWAWLLLRSQARVVRGEIWTASALIMALGVLVTLIISGPGADSALPLALVAPAVAAIGIAFLYGPAVDPALEIELATPTSPRLVLLARLALIFGFDLGLGLAASIMLALQSQVSLWPLVMTWLAPMAFLSSLAFLLAVLSADPGLGTLVSLALWVLLNLARLGELRSLVLPLPDLLAASARPWLWGLALLLGGLALWAAGREERWLGGQAQGVFQFIGRSNNGVLVQPGLLERGRPTSDD